MTVNTRRIGCWGIFWRWWGMMRSESSLLFDSEIEWLSLWNRIFLNSPSFLCKDLLKLISNNLSYLCCNRWTR